jgi:hypothetical protein
MLDWRNALQHHRRAHQKPGRELQESTLRRVVITKDYAIPNPPTLFSLTVQQVAMRYKLIVNGNKWWWQMKDTHKISRFWNQLSYPNRKNPREIPALIDKLIFNK